ncbi:MAG: RHS repeat-associated core domain-containing protein [Verrucomicrobiales bacterium]
MDQTVKRLASSYNAETANSHDHATVGSGSVVNEAAFSYDGFNQMTEDAQSHSGAAGGGTPVVGYAFADGSSGNPTRPTSLTYSDGRILEFGSGSAGRLDERLYATMDYFNATGARDADGDVVERFAYSAFEARCVMAPDFTPRSASTVDWRFAFQGQCLDPETGYYNYGYRFYVPMLRRWVNRNPIWESGGPNVFAFVANSPVNEVDSLGLMPPTSYEPSGCPVYRDTSWLNFADEGKNAKDVREV